MKRRALFALKVVVSVGLLGWVIHTALRRDGIDALGAQLADLSVPWLLAAAGVQLVAIGLGVVRWRLLLRSRRIDIGLPLLVRWYLIGRFVGAFTPSTAGLDVYRAIAVARHTGRRADSTSVVLVEKCVGLLGLSLLAAPAVLWAGSLGPRTLLALALLTVAPLAGLELLRSPDTLSRISRVVPGRIGDKVASIATALSAKDLSAWTAGHTTLLSFGAHAATAAVFVATAGALGLDVAPAQAWLAGAAIVVATLLPISIGGVGVREGVAVVVLGAAGVSPLSATLVALLGYLVGQVPALLGGVLSLSPARIEPPAALSRG